MAINIFNNKNLNVLRPVHPSIHPSSQPFFASSLLGPVTNLCRLCPPHHHFRVNRKWREQRRNDVFAYLGIHHCYCCCFYSEWKEEMKTDKKDEWGRVIVPTPFLRQSRCFGEQKNHKLGRPLVWSLPKNWSPRKIELLRLQRAVKPDEMSILEILCPSLTPRLILYMVASFFISSCVLLVEDRPHYIVC